MTNLWAITCYFNPVGYQRRLANYHTFRRRLTVPLVTVELSTGAGFHLSTGDADVLIQLRSPHVLWHKERLLNIALGAVPRDCHHVAWLDCDIVFERSDWAQRTRDLLEQFALVQPYAQVYEACRHAGPNEVDPAHSDRMGHSLAYGLAVGAAGLDILDQNMRLKGWNSGLAWAGRREVLADHGFYDACILGSGNRAMVCAAVGQFEHAVRYLQMNARWTAHYLAWARPHFDTVRGSIGVAEGRLFHLWHGDLKARKYAERHHGLKEYDFNPVTDIALDDNGCWRWNSDKRQLHQYVEDYFAARKEDG
jgi:hypothetical protein